MANPDPADWLKRLLHPLAARAGFRGFRPLSVRPHGRFWLVEVDGEKIAVPAERRWQQYKRGLPARLDLLAAAYGIDQAPLAPGATVVDIGANVGEVALWAARRGARVIAIEPDPLVHECLTFNTRDVEGIERVASLLWHEPAELTFNSAPADADSSIFAPDSGVAAATLTMQARPLDDVLAPYALDRIDLIKCDAEGAEPEVLDGATETLKKTRFIAIDTGAEREGASTAEACAERLAALGFTVSHRGGARHITFGRR